MSSMDDHRRRSRRGNEKKRAAFGGMARRPRISAPSRKIKMLGLEDMISLMRSRSNGRESRAAGNRAEPVAEE